MTAKPTTSDRKLTLKQRKWLALYIKTGNATEAARQAYDCKSDESARQIGHENIAKLDYQELLEQSGLSDANLIETLKEGLLANKQLAARVIVSKKTPTSQADGEMMVANSNTNDFIEVEDYAVRHKYLETALKLKKRLGTEVGNLTQINTESVNVVWSTGAKP